ncbi:MAG TPA: Gfo/Idh/MocA family oxidoreductase [Armatimonadota bacterium]|nr:Gfo/Idh/MocA family oxidoreductase [Armatimonadota bacterium]HOJ20074.1 Gfo/Idh/MocA family oxidoreductase [Armatimonadota bacterium]HOM80601.1 Gfo/Idh/MocA family oxidoreductase [Armatimonadota bacterium]HOQ27599.1 Gfo/Idh/MocA family oxidoreductase [Armatimonadota bacterium]HPO73513.1 Gfo/Idh/MocA family oxidoreductase [Armatimonadota bacterium]
MERIRLGVIGCGGMSRVHLATAGGKSPHTSEALRPFAERVEVYALADVDLARAEAHRQAYGGEYVTDDPERLFSDPNVDAVLITTWHDTHAAYSLRALESGKHVLIEKPMAMTERECDDIVAAVDRTKLKYMVAFRCRFGRGALDVKREIPHPKNVIAHARVAGIWPETSWAQDPVKGGGQILSQGCHIVDLMFFLAGSEPESVYATGGVFHHSRPDVIDTINASIRFKNGSVGAFLGGDGGTANLMLGHPLPCGCPFWVMAVDQGRSGLTIDHGHDARFESRVPEAEWKPPYDQKIYSQELGQERASGLPEILPTFARCILRDEEPPATAVDGARTTRFILKCFESARTGRVIRFE